MWMSVEVDVDVDVEGKSFSAVGGVEKPLLVGAFVGARHQNWGVETPPL
jgi:hypothetical protein